MYTFFIDGMQCPITPSSLEMTFKNQNKTYTLINEGEINVLKLPGLTTFKFTMLVPQNNYPFAAVRDVGTSDAKEWLRKLEWLKLQRKSFVFTVYRKTVGNRKLFDTSATVSLEEYTVNESAENSTDLEIQVTLKSFPKYGTQKVEFTNVPNNPRPVAVITKTRDASTAPQPSIYTTKLADTLPSIAKRFAQDTALYTAIIAANPGKIANPTKLVAGTVLSVANLAGGVAKTIFDSAQRR